MGPQGSRAYFRSDPTKGQRSFSGQVALETAYGHQIPGVKGHAGVSWGQPEVKLLRNALWQPNLVGRTLDRRVVH